MKAGAPHGGRATCRGRVYTRWFRCEVQTRATLWVPSSAEVGAQGASQVAVLSRSLVLGQFHGCVDGVKIRQVLQSNICAFFWTIKSSCKKCPQNSTLTPAPGEGQAGWSHNSGTFPVFNKWVAGNTTFSNCFSFMAFNRALNTPSSI